MKLTTPLRMVIAVILLGWAVYLLAKVEGLMPADPILAALVIAMMLVVAAAIFIGALPDRNGERPAEIPAKARPPAAPPLDPAAAALKAMIDDAGAAFLASRPPPATPAGPPPGPPAAVLASARQAIVFRQHLPPDHDPGHLSFFGGVPIAPPGFGWPTMTGDDGQAQSLSFVMQIDCAAIPTHGRLGLPDAGVLYLFVDSNWAATDAFRIVHAAAPAGGYAPLTPPADLPLVYGSEVPLVWGWPQSADHCPKLLPKWAFTPMLIDVPEAPVDPDDDPLSAFWNSGGDIKPALLAAQGPIPPAPEPARSAAPLRPFAAFPHDWRAVQIASGLVLERQRWHPEDRDVDPRLELTAAARAEIAARIGATARHWYDLAAGHAPFDAVPADTADDFWTWYAGDEAQRLTWKVNTKALTLAIEASLSASAAAAERVPAEALAHIAARHALAVASGDTIHAPTPDRMLAVPSDVQGNEYELPLTHLLLLELQSKEGIGHHFGEGVYQFWITPDDLAAGEFDRVMITSSAY
jgi:hypothetical protein